MGWKNTRKKDEDGARVAAVDEDLFQKRKNEIDINLPHKQNPTSVMGQGKKEGLEPKPGPRQCRPGSPPPAGGPPQTPSGVKNVF